MVRTIQGIDEVKALRGAELAPSAWLEIDQARIDAFAGCTLDPQWIHVDPERAAGSVFGGAIAHGFLTLSLIPHFWRDTVRIEGFRITINYGVNRVRFPSPVPAGSRIRARFTVPEVADVDGGLQLVRQATIECEGQARPVCVAETVLRLYL